MDDCVKKDMMGVGSVVSASTVSTSGEDSPNDITTSTFIELLYYLINTLTVQFIFSWIVVTLSVLIRQLLFTVIGPSEPEVILRLQRYGPHSRTRLL